MGNATEVTAANFDETIGQGVTMVDFSAEWCQPCKMMAPVIDELATEFDGKATVAKLDIDNAQDIAVKYGVNAVPTFIVFKDGEVANKLQGLQDKDELTQAINAACAG
jgi:thioredoxin 1